MKRAIRVLQVEDEEDDAILVQHELGKAGYDVSCERVDTAQAMRDALEHQPWDAILADFSMPNFTGLSALEALKDSGRDIPFIVVSGKIGEETAVLMMKAGAHDYIMKDNLARLAAAVEREINEASIRRQEKQAKHNVAQLITERQEALEKSRKCLEDAIAAIAATADLRDPYSAGHQREVTVLSDAIAEELKLSDSRREGLHLAGLVHDIGKIYIVPDDLSKPGGPGEFREVLNKTHPQHGYDILKGVDFPWPIAEIVLQHHERLDGSGYPQGLKGNDILLEARILQVADVVETLTSSQKADNDTRLQEAMKEILHGRGTLYDPDVVDACIALLDSNRFNLKPMALQQLQR